MWKLLFVAICITNKANYISRHIHYMHVFADYLPIRMWSSCNVFMWRRRRKIFLPWKEGRPPENHVQIQGNHVDVFDGLELGFDLAESADLCVHGKADCVVGMMSGRGLHGTGVPGGQGKLVTENVQKNDVAVSEKIKRCRFLVFFENIHFFRGSEVRQKCKCGLMIFLTWAIKTRGYFKKMSTLKF